LIVSSKENIGSVPVGLCTWKDIITGRLGSLFLKRSHNSSLTGVYKAKNVFIFWSACVITISLQYNVFTLSALKKSLLLFINFPRDWLGTDDNPTLIISPKTLGGYVPFGIVIFLFPIIRLLSDFLAICGSLFGT